VILLEIRGKDGLLRVGDAGPRLLWRETGATVVATYRAGSARAILPETKYDLMRTPRRSAGSSAWEIDRNSFSSALVGGFLIRYEAPANIRPRVKGLVFVDPFTFEFVDGDGSRGNRQDDGHAPSMRRSREAPEVPAVPRSEWMGAPGSNLAEKCDRRPHGEVRKGLARADHHLGPAVAPASELKLWRESTSALTAVDRGRKLIIAKKATI